VIFDARYIARGWLAVALASATDKDRPALNRTVHIEEHAAGLRLVATDSYVLLHSFVPDLDHDLADEPELDEAPSVTATAIDPHGRAKGFLAHVLKLARQAEENNTGRIEVRVRLNVLGARDDDGHRPPSFDGMEARSVVVEQPDVERVMLDSYEGQWPTGWRSVMGGFRPVDTGTIALNPDIVGRLARLGKVHPAGLLGWTFGGKDRAARVEVIYAEPAVEGLVMPCRWDFSANAPRVDEPAPPADDEDVEEVAAGADPS
jgi:hypothetical protein